MFWRRKRENLHEKIWGVKGPNEYEVLAWLMADLPRIEEALDVVGKHRESVDEALEAKDQWPYLNVGTALKDWVRTQPGVPQDQDRRQDLAHWCVVPLLDLLDWRGLAKYLLDNEPAIRRVLDDVERWGLPTVEGFAPLNEFSEDEPRLTPGRRRPPYS